METCFGFLSFLIRQLWIRFATGRSIDRQLARDKCMKKILVACPLLGAGAVIPSSFKGNFSLSFEPTLKKRTHLRVNSIIYVFFYLTVPLLSSLSSLSSREYSKCKVRQATSFFFVCFGRIEFMVELYFIESEPNFMARTLLSTQLKSWYVDLWIDFLSANFW